MLTCPQLTNIFLHYFSPLVLATQRTLLLGEVVVLLSIHSKASTLPLLPTMMEKLW